VQVAEAVLPGTVMIQAGSATGSGFVLDTAGRIMTNNHVVAAADGGRIRVVFADGRRLTATLLGRSPSYDIAVVQVRASGLRPLQIGDSDASRVGEPVIAVGSPLGLPGTVTQGIVVHGTDRWRSATPTMPTPRRPTSTQSRRMHQSIPATPAVR
jgi:putative serine protease PepD